jgi:hypothetical protein
MQRSITPEELDTFYHAIGSAVWHIQYLEDVLVGFITLKEHKFTNEEEAYERLEQQRKGTLGWLCKKAKEVGIIPVDLVDRLDRLLAERNWLTHNSRQACSTHLYNDHLRDALIDRIIAIMKESIDLRNLLFNDFQRFVAHHGVDLEAADRVAENNMRKLLGLQQ